MKGFCIYITYPHIYSFVYLSCLATVCRLTHSCHPNQVVQDIRLLSHTGKQHAPLSSRGPSSRRPHRAVNESTGRVCAVDVSSHTLGLRERLCSLHHCHQITFFRDNRRNPSSPPSPFLHMENILHAVSRVTLCPTARILEKFSDTSMYHAGACLCNGGTKGGRLGAFV